jgi:hypothetical protein
MEIYLIIHLLQYPIALVRVVLVVVVRKQYHRTHQNLNIMENQYFVKSYINAYETAFNQSRNSQRALYNYQYFNPGNINNNTFVPGTFGYYEQYNGQGSNLGNSITIDPLQDYAGFYSGIPSLFISAGSGGGSGFIYLDWIIVTYGVPYVISAS